MSINMKNNNNCKYIYNPEFIIKSLKYKSKTFHLLSDTTFGGTKFRVLLTALQNFNENEIIYAGPDTGMAHLAIGAASKILKKKPTIFLSSGYRKTIHPLVKFGIKYLNINYKLPKNINGRTLKDALKDATNYSKNDENKLLLPFGLQNKEFINIYINLLKDAVKNIKQPKRMWLVVGSGMILKAFQTIWPETKFMCVQVGKTVWPDQIEQRIINSNKIVQDELFIANEPFETDAKIQPPYLTIPWYDAKVWQFIIKFGNKDDYIWNTSELPDINKLKLLFKHIECIKK